ncbi:WD repeat-containing protein 55 [Cucumis melo var. makuwa]|uniref:WD repeat-containing protein 55 n=1 Tax=Cucumis melo var. makuwa TaxID=1194695 RepID=A0A5D3D5H4_CUCMM|nr:WD repeat-containing protein 55 [Cucumis melo var. makuwa]
MEINLADIPFDLDFHPSDQLVAAGVIGGNLHLYRYDANALPQKLFKVRAHVKSCRAVRFINDGRAILTGSSDHSILSTDVETGSVIARLEDAHDEAVSKLINITSETIASGDDNGAIKVWDTRQRSCCSSFKAHEDYISDMTYSSDSTKLLATSDRFVDASQNPVNALLKLDEDRVIVASESGLISLVGILPNRVIQPIAEHSDYPVERLAFSHDRKFLGSISHDYMIKLISVERVLLGELGELWDMDLLQSSGNAPTTVEASASVNSFTFTED